MQFTTGRQLDRLITSYFEHIAGEWHHEEMPPKNKANDQPVKQRIWTREAEPPTISGLAITLVLQTGKPLTITKKTALLQLHCGEGACG